MGLGNGMVAVMLMGLAAVPVQAAAPKGWVQFCSSNPSQCVSQGSDKVPMTIDLLAELDTVNHSVNGSMQYTSEAAGLDDWRMDATLGDCEDYAITKRSKLMALGVDQNALRIAIVLTEDAEFHAVLVVVTDEVKLVLDNRYETVETFSETGYILVGTLGSDPMNFLPQVKITH